MAIIFSITYLQLSENDDTFQYNLESKAETVWLHVEK